MSQEPASDVRDVDGELEAWVSTDCRYFELRITSNVEMSPEAIFVILDHCVETYRSDPAKFFRDWARCIPKKNDLP